MWCVNSGYLLSFTKYIKCNFLSDCLFHSFLFAAWMLGLGLNAGSHSSKTVSRSAGAHAGTKSRIGKNLVFYHGLLYQLLDLKCHPFKGGDA